MQTVTMAIECDAGVAEALEVELREATQSEVTSAQKNSLDGSPQTVMQIIQVATSLAAGLTSLLATYIGNKRVRKIKFGPIEIENPSREQWERLWRDYLADRGRTGEEGEK